MVRRQIPISLKGWLREFLTGSRPRLTLRRTHYKGDRGFALPLTMGLGLIMLLLGTMMIVTSQASLTIARQRKGTGLSLAVTETGIDRILTQLNQANNSGLLTLNYDTINPQTGTTYLGPDGILQNGDEESTAIDEWTSFSPSSSTCTSGGSSSPSLSYVSNTDSNGQYTLKAYRYDSTKQTGTLLVEGQQGVSTSMIAVTLAINSQVVDFPGVLSVEKVNLLGRNILGSNGNLYYDPTLSEDPSLQESAAVGDPDRPDYLNAIKSGSNDGITTDNVSGKIIACKLTPTLSYAPQGSNLCIVDASMNLSGSSSGITYYQTDEILLKNNDIVEVDTTNGPVYIYVNGPVQILDNAKLRNIRTDSLSPRVGDLRIILTIDQPFKVQDAACVETAFIYSRQDKLELTGKADGCPSSGDSNIDGVVWVKEIFQTSGDFSGISVPDDVSSLSDILNSVNLSTSNRVSSIVRWERVIL